MCVTQQRAALETDTPRMGLLSILKKMKKDEKEAPSKNNEFSLAGAWACVWAFLALCL